MKKFLLFLCVLFLALGASGAAIATPVTFDVDGPNDSYVNLFNVSSCGWTSISATLADLDSVPNFTLDDNEAMVIDFFTFSASGIGIGSFDLEANLNFDAPAIDAGGEGSGEWGTFFGLVSAGEFHWNDAMQEFTLADGNVVSIALEQGIALVLGSDVTVHATITNLGGGTAPVPEPATMILLGIGLAGLAGLKRRKK